MLSPRKKKNNKSAAPARPAGASRRLAVGGFPIVVVTEAGNGGEAVLELVRALPAMPGMALIFLPVPQPGRAALLLDELRKTSSLPLAVAADAMRAEANRLYVAPDDAVLAVRHGEFQVFAAPNPSQMAARVDTLLCSLAEDQGQCAVGVVLGGNSSDGVYGLRAIKEHGGMTMAQLTPAADADPAPRHAIAAGVVDYVEPPAGLAGKLIQLAQFLADFTRPGARAFAAEAAGQLGPIYAALRRSTGHDFSLYKETTFLRRLQRRMQVRQLKSLPTYVELLQRDTDEVQQLFDELLIGVTQFFRDAHVFAQIERELIPAILEKARRENTIRVWVPGCATGEEAYSLAMLFHEQLARLPGTPPKVQIFATDIDQRALEVARQGRYPENIAAQIEPLRLERHFTRHGSILQVNDELRDMCVFAAHNLTKDPPFSRIDLVSCRNLLIYLAPELQRKLVRLFHYALRAHGFLVLGPAENVTGHADLFASVHKAHRLFQRKNTLLAPPLEIPIEGGRRLTLLEPPASTAKTPANLARSFERIILERVAPPCAIVDASHKIVFVSGRTGDFLEFPPGKPDTNVINLARRGLKLELRHALERAAGGTRSVEAVAAVDTGRGRRRVRLVLEPLAEFGRDSGLTMITFHEIAGDEGHAAPAAAEEPIVHRLESELRTTREHLQNTIEDLESSNEALKASNEELMSMNEELQTGNEELETSKEELQSVNEELEAVNTELAKKIEEVDRANADVRNFLESTQIATVFLDRGLRIRQFTPAISDVFQLRSSDIGRRITDFASTITGLDLVAESQAVLSSNSPRQFAARQPARGIHFIVRILPYRRAEGVCDGVVVTFVDITELRRAQEERNRLAALVDSAHDAVIGKALDGTITSWNSGAERLYGYSAEEAIGQNIEFIIPEEYRETQRRAQAAAAAGQLQGPVEVVRRARDGRLIPLLLTISPIRDDDDQVVGYSAISQDITAQKAAAEELERTKNALAEQLADMTTLHQLIQRLVSGRGLNHLLEEILQGALSVVQASMGAVQLVDPTGKALQLIAAHGFPPDVRELCAESPRGVSACGRAWETKQRVIVEDAATDPIFADAREIVARAGFRAVQSTPLLNSRGEVIGALSTHWPAPHRPTDRQLRLLDLYARFATEIVERAQSRAALTESRERFRLAALATNEALWDCDLVSGTIWWNEAYAKAFNRPPDSNRSGQWWREQIHPDDRERVRQSLREAIESHGVDSWSASYRFRRGDGEWADLYDRAYIARDEHGRATRIVGSMLDLTEQRRTEHALHDSQKRFTQLLKLMPAAVYTCDLDGKITFYNRRAAELWGREPGAGDTDQKFCGSFRLWRTDGSPLPHAQTPMAQALSDGSTVRNEEVVIEREDGSRITVVVNIEPVVDAAGVRLGAINVFQDITASRLAAETIQAKEEQLRLVTNTSPVMLAQCSRDLRFVFVNRAYAERLNRTPEDIAGRSLDDVMGAAALASIRPYIERALAGETLNYELLVPYESIGDRYMRVSYSPYGGEPGRPDGWIASISDITDRKLAENALQQQAQMLAQAHDAIIAWEWKRCIRYWNRGAELIYGYTAAQAVGQVSHRLLETEVEGGLAALEAALERDGQWLGELSHRRQDGRRIIVESRMALTRPADGPAVVVETNRDITDRKRAEQQLREAQAELLRHSQELERVVAQRTAKLQESIADLEAFSYSVSHDLRSPLRTMHGFAEALLEDHAQKLDAIALDYLKRIKVGAERLDRLTADLLAYSRAGREQVEIARVDLDEMLSEMLQHVPELRKQAEFVTVERPLPAVMGNATALAQCVSNLLGNALKFVAPGQPPRVRVRSEARDDRVRLIIADQGIGVPAEDLHRIFGLFERLHPRHAYDGTGIGLAIVKKAVERMHGSVGVESRLGEGSTFWIELPAAKP